MQAIELSEPVIRQTALERTEIALAVVAQIYGVETKELRTATRGNPRAAMARQIAIYLGHIVFRMTISELGACFGRNRSTALHAVRRVEEMRDDPEVECVLLQLEILLRRAVGEAA